MLDFNKTSSQNIRQINVIKRTFHPVKRIFSAERLSTERGAPGSSLQKSLGGRFSCCFTSQKVAFQLPALLPPRETGESAALSASSDPLSNKGLWSCFSFFLFFFYTRAKLTALMRRRGGQGQVKIHPQLHGE